MFADELLVRSNALGDNRLRRSDLYLPRHHGRTGFRDIPGRRVSGNLPLGVRTAGIFTLVWRWELLSLF